VVPDVVPEVVLDDEITGAQRKKYIAWAGRVMGGGERAPRQGVVWNQKPERGNITNELQNGTTSSIQIIPSLTHTHL